MTGWCGNRSPITGECIIGCPGFGGCKQGKEDAARDPDLTPDRTPAQLVAEFRQFAGFLSGNDPAQIRKVSVRMIRAVGAVIEAAANLIGPAEDPNVGWHSGLSTDPEEFKCEFCLAQHADCTLVPHTDDCPVTVIRALLP